jgi:hypothetical protein
MKPKKNRHNHNNHKKAINKNPVATFDNQQLFGALLLLRMRSMQTPFLENPTLEQTMLKVHQHVIDNNFLFMVGIVVQFMEYDESSYIPVWVIEACIASRKSNKVVRLELLGKSIAERLLEFTHLALNNAGLPNPKIEKSATSIQLKTPLTDAEIDVLPKGFKDLIRK